ncbi:MAG: hypothetical protein ABIW76_11265 [Fibrobacteria bacterium]
MPTSIRQSPCAYPLLFWVAITTAACTVALSAPMPTRSETAPGGKSVSSGSRAPLDTASVRKYYMEGDFEPAILIIEDGLKSGRPFNHNDSIFAFKHLGVMYAARYESREKGKYYMHQLLMTEPTARIMDMYASDMIYMIFKNIQDEFEANRSKLTPQKHQAASQGSDGPSSWKAREAQAKEEPKRKPESKSGNYYWIGATGLLVAAGVGAYFVMAEDPEPIIKNHPVE